MRGLVFLVLAVFFITSVFSQENTFIRTYNLEGMHGGLSLAVMPDGGFVGTGQHADLTLGCRIYAYRIDECGNIIWFNLYNGGGGVSITATHDNGVVIAASGGRILKLNSSGVPEWEKYYPNIGGGYMQSIIQTSDYGYFAGGETGELLKLDFFGDVIWSAQVSGRNIHALDEFPNGDFMYFSWDGASWFLGRVDPTGVLIWENEYNSGGSSGDNHNDWAGEALIDINLNQIVVASNSSNNSGDVLIVSLDYNGNVIASNAFGSLSDGEFVRSIDITDDGGYIIGGGTYGYNTTSTSVLTQSPGVTPENLTGRDILLFKVSSLLDFEWSSVIGCGGSEKAIGVRTNQDNGYTVSAYTDGTFFGAGGINSFDPLFIKTDNLGRVGCQQYSPPLIQTTIPLTVVPTNSLTLQSISLPDDNPVMYDSISPTDYYMCLECATTPFFTISDQYLCVGDTTYFVNGSSGLICFQDWYVDGVLISGSADSVAFSFSTPGMHNILLETSCGAGVVQYDLDFYVNNIRLFVTDISNYNGYEVSCNGYDNGYIETYVTSPFPPVIYSWTTSDPTGSSQYNLEAGIYHLQLSDNYGCILDTNIILEEPPPLTVISTYAHDTCGRQVGMAEVIISGGVLNYQYLWSNNDTNSAIYNLYGGEFEVTITDANNCLVIEEFNIDPELIDDPIAGFKVIPSVTKHHLYEQLDNPILFIDQSVDDFAIIIAWFWDFDDGFTSEEKDPQHSFIETGDYNVTLAIENLYGCVDTIKKRVIVEEFLLYIPNSFTPQGDGINDVFLPKGIGIDEYELAIYNRWGAHIFSSKDLEIGWDGTTEQEDGIAQFGLYVYVIEIIDVFGESHSYTGEVYLLK